MIALMNESFAAVKLASAAATASHTINDCECTRCSLSSLSLYFVSLSLAGEHTHSLTRERIPHPTAPLCTHKSGAVSIACNFIVT